jgi:hypothetical protein
MIHPELRVDCRGLPTAITALRIQQTLDGASTDKASVLAQVSPGCCVDEVVSGLRSGRSVVRFVARD